MKKFNLCCLALLCLFCTVQAQDNNTDIQPLTIGDQVPDVTIQNLTNYPEKEAHVSDFRGRWLILDFWATWCSPCISMFPKTDSLQEIFKDQVQFVAVTYEKQEEVSRLFAKLKSLKELKPVMATGDKTLRFLFPHKDLPHYVWIDPQGRVAAITGRDEVTYNGIQNAINESALAMPLKAEKPINFNRFEPLLTGNLSIANKKVIYQSALSGYIPGLPSAYGIYEQGKGTRILATNSRLVSLYKMAYGYAEDIYLNSNRIIIEVADKSRFVTSAEGADYGRWLRQNNGFCYELISPEDRKDNQWLIMQQDLNRYFPEYDARLEKRMRKVLALVRISDEDKISTKGGVATSVVKSYEARLQNVPLRTLILHLNAKYLQLLPTPVVDLTGFTGKVDITLEAELSNVGSLRKALQQYDLDLREQTAKIKVLVIRDNTEIKSNQ